MYIYTCQHQFALNDVRWVTWVTKVTYFYAGTRILLQFRFTPHSAQWVTLITKVAYFWGGEAW